MARVAFAVDLIHASPSRVGVEGACATNNTAGVGLVLSCTPSRDCRLSLGALECYEIFFLSFIQAYNMRGSKRERGREGGRESENTSLARCAVAAILTRVSWVAFAVALIRASSRRVGVEGTCATRNTAGNILVLASAAFFTRLTVYTCMWMLSV